MNCSFIAKMRTRGISGLQVFASFSGCACDGSKVHHATAQHCMELDLVLSTVVCFAHCNNAQNVFIWTL